MNRKKYDASFSKSLVVGDQKVAIKHKPNLKIVPATFWNTNNGGGIQFEGT
jgi:hypothetical protein